MSDQLDDILSRWAAVGVGFDAASADEAVDVERLLLDTARHAPRMARLFVMAATWLHRYGDLVAKHRLKRLIEDELEEEHKPVLGLLLDVAQQGSHPPEFASIVRHLPAAGEIRPLFESARRDARLAERARRRATALSHRWNLWCGPVEFKDDAIRPSSWIMASQPHLRTRADMRGDLRVSVLAALRHDPGAGDSELRLARLAGGSRAQVREALRNLEMTGRVETRRAEGANRREVRLGNVA